MRIVSINVHYQDGLGYQDYYLGLEFQRMGHEIVFVSSDWHFAFPDYDNTVRHLLGDPHVGVGVFTNSYGAQVHRLKARFRSSNFIWLEGLFAKLEELKPDLIISHGLLTWQTARLALFGKSISAPIIFDDHTHFEVLRQSAVAKLLYFVFRWTLGQRIHDRATKVVGITPETVPIITDVFGVAGGRVEMIPLGTDTTLYFPDPAKRKRYRSELGLNSDDILVLYTGKIYSAKKADHIVDAANKICAAEPELAGKIVILFVGDMAKDCQHTITSKAEASPCRVITRAAVSQEKLAEVYNGADIAVWPASATTSTIDASACGVPIIITNRLPERLEFNSGIGITPGDLGELTQALEKLIKKEHLRQEMGQGGIELVEKKLSWKIIAAQFLS